MGGSFSLCSSQNEEETKDRRSLICVPMGTAVAGVMTQGRQVKMAANHSLKDLRGLALLDAHL